MRPAILGLALAALLSGCGSGAAPWPPPPADVRYGEDSCASCRMTVSDPRYAAQAVDRGGRARFYDDLGCLLEDRAVAHPEPEGVLVRPYSGDGWIRGDAGWTVRSRDLQSPMGSGIAAFPTREAAEAEARRRRGATVASLADLLAASTPPESVPQGSVVSR